MKKNNYPSSIFSALRKDLSDQVFSSSIGYLNESTDIQDLHQFKNQGLLSSPNLPKDLFFCYLENIRRLSTDPELIRLEENYVCFLEAFFEATMRYNQGLIQLLSPYLNRNLKSFLYPLIKPLGTAFDGLFSQMYEELSKQTTDEMTSEVKSELHSLAHNQIRGAIADTLFAVTRLINFYAHHKSEVISPLVYNTIRDEDEILFMEAIRISSNINSFYYALDKIACGEWIVNSAAVIDAGFEFKFSMIDVELEKARQLGVRRIMIAHLLGRKKQRWLAQFLEPYCLSILEVAWDYYQDALGIFVSGTQKFDQLKADFIRQLDELDAEDELLFGLNRKNIDVVSHYYTAITIACFVYAARSLSERASTSYQLTCPEIPETLIEKLISRTKVGDHFLISKIADYLTELPIRQHLELFKMPCIRDHSGKIYSLVYIADQGWPQRVRTNLMRGGKIADQIGKAWEDYIAGILLGDGWEKAVQGVKIKENGEILTDIDIIAKRQDLLLLVQLKVHYGAGTHNYDQWKFRQKLIHGVAQVKKSELNIMSKKSVLSTNFSKVELDEIKFIQSVVMTNDHIFNGWKYDGVTIMSTAALMQLVNGAEVRYTSQKGQVIEIKSYAKNRNLSTKEIIDFIATPLDWKIASSEFKIDYHKEDFGKYVLHFPYHASIDHEGF
ncbi:hypothetical protein [Pedobacter gandavensis]|uniref:NERD domain-containing protein n=1 Tax=Pedobacter gandavensis TaxID=2679963 RepID=A0ABR6EQ52_9SPHI|nr:hypothetical protein [Pedobacter gandavensis]MBB2147371.1 hypothetical protein [Pedobacter gandavensis]